MRLHRLRLQAFGPFAGCEQIDFDDVSTAGLYLIHGPTGSGKSSILDAICFALFSGVPGNRMQGRSTLHSDHAAATRPEVELEFTVGDRRMRVRRSPEHQVAKKRGTGTRSQRSTVQLEELQHGHWATVGTRADEVGQVIGDLLDMGLSQFAQVMLLPQGEFTAFLRAKPDDRGRLLERLFDISDFAAVERWLVDHRRGLETETVRADAHRAALIARAQETLSAIPTDDEPEDALPPDLDEAGGTDALRTLTERLSDRLTAALAAADRAAADADAVRARLQDQRALAALQTRARSAQQVLDDLDARAATVRDAEQRLADAQRSDGCRPALAALDRRRAALRSADDATQRTCRELAALSAWSVPQPPEERPLSETALQPLHERADAGTAALAGQPELLRQVETIERELHAATREHQHAVDRATRCAADLSEAADRLTAATTELDGCRDRAVTDPHWRALQGRLESASRATTTAITDLQCATQRDEEHRAAHQVWAAAEQEVLRLRQARLAGIAAELATDLHPGDPCPVCGAVEHPRLARTGPGHVDAERVAAAEDAASTALARAERAASKWSAAAGRAEASCGLLRDALDACGCPDDQAPGLDTRLDDAARGLQSVSAAARPCVAGLLDALRDDPPRVGTGRGHRLATLSAELDSLRAAVAGDAARAAEAAQQLSSLQDRCEELRHTQLTAERAATSATETTRAALGRVESLRTQLTAARERLDELTREHDTVCGCSRDAADPGAAHTRCVAHLTALTTTAHTAQVAAEELDDAREEVDRALREHRFADIAAARAAALAAEEQGRLRASIEAAHTERAKATGVLEQPGMAQARACDPADVDGVAAELSVAERSARQAHEAVSDLRRSLQSLERVVADLRAHDERCTPLHRRLAVATSLAAAVTGSGDNVMRMRLTAYVLAARLETVTALANQRLHAMTAGRYQLEHTDEKAGRGTKSGLGLRVRDAWTGTTRDTSTLSGGESFIASLALALGLGDAVLQSAGGRRLETLLVDEGFGSLDEESLDQVLDVLDTLRAGGRSVGIVSHVAELRSRIPAQIRVTKTTSGSTLQVHHRAAEVA